MRIGCLGVQPGRMIDQDAIRARYNALGPFLNERDRRLFAACEARAAGRGGIVAVSRTTGIARSTIGRGLADLRSGGVRCREGVRRRGGGQKPPIEIQPGILEALNELVEPSIRGDPEAALRWVSLTQRHLSAALAKRGFIAGQKLVGRLLKRLNFSLQANRKTREGANHPDRNETSRTAVVSCGPRDSRRRSGCMTSPFLNSARPCRMESTTLPPMLVSSMSASAPTLESSLSRAFDAGGTKSALRVIR